MPQSRTRSIGLDVHQESRAAADDARTWLGGPDRVRLGWCQRDQRIQLLKHFRHRGWCECANEADFACLPIQDLDLIRQNGARNR